MSHLKKSWLEQHPCWSRKTPRIEQQWVCRGYRSGWWSIPFSCSAQSRHTWPRSLLEQNKEGPMCSLIKHWKALKNKHLANPHTFQLRVHTGICENREQEAKPKWNRSVILLEAKWLLDWRKHLRTYWSYVLLSGELWWCLFCLLSTCNIHFFCCCFLGRES